ncbi:hypothetical protein J8273_1389 [Carpediemonas membranifera]|uniref:Uncharacterized protein n=1 Tax=Carpediemonas membranifera TaxID=201153 RepID=A0A8J6BGI5_9EUKA|nr:hypothetical protein J8273_1389 [Carpediemonas membranifera]|eukprot:KAG9397032.1 hypothetical protein J8273_1389 [Carpediemonas membranifera]
MGVELLLRRRLDTRGLVINAEKSILTPVQRLEFLGVILDTTLQQVSISQERATKYRGTTGGLMRVGQTFAASVSQQAMLSLRPLQKDMPDPLVPSYVLPKEKIDALRHWVSLLSQKLPPRSWEDLRALWGIGEVISVSATSDASEKGWGAVVLHKGDPPAKSQGRFPPHLMAESIMVKELYALEQAD